MRLKNGGNKWTNRRDKSESSWVKSTHDAYENTWKCGELKLYFSPSAGGWKKKKKKDKGTRGEEEEAQQYSWGRVQTFEWNKTARPKRKLSKIECEQKSRRRHPTKRRGQPYWVQPAPGAATMLTCEWPHLVFWTLLKRIHPLRVVLPLRATGICSSSEVRRMVFLWPWQLQPFLSFHGLLASHSSEHSVVYFASFFFFSSLACFVASSHPVC